MRVKKEKRKKKERKTIMFEGTVLNSCEISDALIVISGK